MWEIFKRKNKNQTDEEAAIATLKNISFPSAGRISMSGIWGEEMRRIDGVDFAGDFSIPIAKSKNIYQRIDGEWVELTPVKHCHNESEVADCDEFICSNCHIHLEGYAWVDIDDDDGEKTYHEFSCRFCPQCGAKVE